jgi:O-methyltransferase involved in polyketide biosynthesis
MSSDEAVQYTNNEAASFKTYAVSKGYWNDPYVKYFASTPMVSKNKFDETEHRPPEMSRGYYARVDAVRSTVRKFIKSQQEKPERQIVNLGAGFDTLYFNLNDENCLPTRYIEVDFSRVNIHYFFKKYLNIVFNL